VTVSVLDVEHIVRWAPGLGPHVTIAQFDGGMHDLTLSGKEVRVEVFRELGRWVEGFLPAPGTPEPEIPPAPEDQPGVAAVLEEAEAVVERAAVDEADDKSGTTA
jgi:hypothetical protein